MAPPVPTAIPATLVVGDRWQWTATYPDYPATEGWTLQYRVWSAADPERSLAITATTSGTGYAVDVAAATTAQLVGGPAYYAAWVTSGSDRRTLATAEPLTLVGNLAIPDDSRTHAERTLALIEAAIEGRIPSGMESYTIAGRQLTKIPLRDLYQLRRQYRDEVALARRGGAFLRHEVTFGAA